MTDQEKQVILKLLMGQLLRDHPLPWRIEQDWTNEIVSEDRTIIAKCPPKYDAQTIIKLAKEFQAELDANIESAEEFLRASDAIPQKKCIRHYVGISHCNHLIGRIDVAKADAEDVLQAKVRLVKWAKQKKIRLKCNQYCAEEFADSLADLKKELTGTIYGDIVDALEDTVILEIVRPPQ